MPQSSITEELYARLGNARIKSESTKYFVPPESVKEILTRPNIERCIAENIPNANELIGLSEKIEEDGVTVFAILLWMHRVPSIVKFHSHGCLDNRLPLGEGQAMEVAPDFGRTFAQETQWQFLPYHFEKDMCNYHLTLQTCMILPFVQKSGIKEGVFGEVCRMQVVAGLQDFIESKVCEISRFRFNQ
jgi:hypothetical protein